MQLCLFDLLCYGDASRCEALYERSLAERKQRLRELFPSREESGIHVVEGRVLDETPEQLAALVRESVAAGCEGLVLKRTEGRYACGCRNSGSGGSE